MDTEKAPMELLARVDELDGLEARRRDLGPGFLRRNIGLSLFSAATVASILPVALDYTPLEYGLPWFVLAMMGVVGAKSVSALVRGLNERRELDEQIAAVRAEIPAGQIGSESAGRAS